MRRRRPWKGSEVFDRLADFLGAVAVDHGRTAGTREVPERRLRLLRVSLDRGVEVPHVRRSVDVCPRFPAVGAEVIRFQDHFICGRAIASHRSI